MNLESPDSGRRPPLEPVLPLINVVFLLLIFFMVAGHLGPIEKTDVQAPESASGTIDEDLTQLMLVLNKDGQLLRDGEPLDVSELPALLEARRAAQAEKQALNQPQVADQTPASATATNDDDDTTPPVRLLTDAGTPLKILRESLATLRDAGVAEVRLVTRSESGS
ncbi:ExbD/TolR family protein [Alloalcanivorax mobilis]|uniref:ExbD/TolR family protein n=1 Tax=Alloalcanivorax mobilis TaxID=2019569 RepID=UPI000C78A076|nr:biopolymer transporter ExbD [Alloalcanivorax mobilis]